MLRNVIALFVGSFILFNCNNDRPIQKPDNLMAEELYMDLFYELELLSVYQDRGAKGSVVDSLYEEIFKKYNSDKDIFLSSHKYFQSQIIEQQIRADSVIKKIERNLIALDRLDSLTTQEGAVKE